MPSRRVGDGLCVWRVGGGSVASAVRERLSEFVHTNLLIGANLRLRIVSLPTEVADFIPVDWRRCDVDGRDVRPSCELRKGIQ